MKKIVINEEACIGCGACMGAANEVFDYNDEGYATVKENVNYETLSDEVKEEVTDAIDGCPTAAIELSED